MKFLLGLAMACLVFASCKTGGTGSSEGELSASRTRSDPSWSTQRCTTDKDIVWFGTPGSKKVARSNRNNNKKTIELEVKTFEAPSRKLWQVEAVEVIDGGGFSPGLKVPYKFEVKGVGSAQPVMSMYGKQSESDPQWESLAEDQPCTPLY